MSILEPVFRFGNAIEWEREALNRTSPDDAKLIAMLADKAMETAKEFGAECTRRDAIARAKTNLAWARAEIERVTG